MKIITEPTVRLIGRMQFFPHALYELPPHDNDAENIIATAGKICYDSYGKDGRSVVEHIRALTGSKHDSVLEHAVFSLYLGGISRGCSHEIVRHRHFSYSQRSTRYTAEGDAAFVLDPYYADIYRRMYNDDGVYVHSSLDTTGQERAILGTFLESCREGMTKYEETVGLLSNMSEDTRLQQGLPTNARDLRKWVRGKARQLLPHALETRMVMTGNIRAWKHFLLMRTSRHAEAEIRRLAHFIWTILQQEAPVAFGDLRASGHPSGYVELVAPLA